MANVGTKNAANGAATLTDTPDAVKFTEGERAIMLRINHLETIVDRLAVKVGALMGTFDRKADRILDAAQGKGKKGGAE